MGNVFSDAWEWAEDNAVRIVTDIATLGMAEVYWTGMDAVDAMMPGMPTLPDSRKDREVMTTAATTPRKIVYGRAKVGGQLVYAQSTGTNNELLHMVVVFTGHTINAWEALYLDDKEISTFHPDWVSVEYFSGSQTTACANLVTASGGLWTANHVLYGCAYVYLKLKYDVSYFPSGIPKVTAVIQGKQDIYDPRTATSGYTDNPALCTRDYMVMPVTAGGMGCTAAEIDDVIFAASASICEGEVYTAAIYQGNEGGKTLVKPVGTANRYHCNGIISIQGTPKSILEGLLSSMAGSAVYSEGVWKIYAGCYDPPSPIPAIDESWLAGPITFTTGPNKSGRLNTVKGTYVDPYDLWATKEFPAITSATYKAEDEDEELLADLNLNYTNSIDEALQLARLTMHRSRLGVTVSMICNHKAFKLQPHDIVTVSNTILGWSSKVFRVAEWSFGTSGGIGLSLVEEYSSVYTDTNADDITIPALTNLPDPRVVTAPVNISVAETLYATLVQSVLKVKAVVTWDAQQSASRFIVSLDGVEVADIPGQVNQHTIMDIEAGAHVFSVCSVNSLGYRSAFTSLNYTVQGKLAPPSAVATFLVAKQPDGTREFSWTHPDLPLDLAGYRIRYISGSTGTWADMTPLHSGLIHSSPYESNQLAAGEYTFALCAEDTSGILSDAKYITVTLDNPRMAGIALSASFGALGWSGTKTDCYVNELGYLSATGTKDWADFATDVVTWADWTAWNRVPSSPIVYEHAALDIGAVMAFTPLVTVVGDGTATITISYSDDNSTYTSFAAITATPISARYIKVKVSMAGSEPALHAIIVYLSAQQITEEINDYTPSSGDFRLPIAKTYAVIQSVQIALQNVGAGWSWEIIDKSASLGPRIKIYNSSNTLAAATIDASVKGL